MRSIEPAKRIEQPLNAPSAAAPVEIELSKDLWKYALLVMSISSGGLIKTPALIAALPEYIALGDEHLTANDSRADSTFSQIVRNLKPHRNSNSSFIYQGYAQDVPGGFQITRKGLDFRKEYFSENG